MSSTAAYSDTDINQAALLSHLSGKPAHVCGDIFVWNGTLIDRASAVVSLLKVYNQVPVSTSAKEKLYSQYKKKFENKTKSLITDDSNDQYQIDIWFYKLCKAIKGEIATRDSEDIKNILIALHR